ncbi:MAG: hypothetical protein IPK52_18455 [Chloroflexi bacterium]|nr:hypothetical protein [Chloroflexota bacterium]
MRRTGIAMLVLLFSLVMPASAQDDSPRAAPPNDSFVNRDVIHWGAQVNVSSLEDATIQTNEPLPSCAVDVNNRSVWYQISVPAGKLRIRPLSLTHDVLVTLYEGTGSIVDLNELACEFVPTGMLGDLSKKLEPGTYIVRFASGDSTPLPAMTMEFNITLTPPAGIAAPPNKSPQTSLGLVFNKAVTTPNMEYAVPYLSTITSCGGNVIGNSLFYTFTLPSQSQVNISSEGSALGYAPVDYRTTTVMRLSLQTAPNAYSQVGCNAGAGVSGAARLDLTLDAGKYVIELGHTSTSLTASSSGVVRVVVDELEVLVNGGFEADLAGWKLTNATTDAIFTGAQAITGNKSFRFVGGPNEATQLKQKIPLSMIKMGPNSLLEWRATLECTTVPEKDMTIKIKAIYADGATETKSFPLLVPTFTGLPVADTATVLLKRAKPISLQITIKNTAGFGDCLLDDLGLIVISTYGARGVLPLPVPPRNGG